MQGTIVQTLGMVLAVNARLRGIHVPLWPDGSAFTFCSAVRFVDPGKRGWFGRRAAVLATDPAQWLDSLDPGTRGARVRVVGREHPMVSDWMSVGLVGGGSRWLIDIEGPHSTLWEAAWSLGDREADRIWNVVYLRIDSDAGAPLEDDLDLAGCKAALGDVLDGISRFAAENDLGFVEMFDGARRRLDDANPMNGLYHADMAPESLLPLAARQLLAASQSGWVFGGMGSWNDAMFDGDLGREHARWSEQLFVMLQRAAAMAVNSSYPDRD